MVGIVPLNVAHEGVNVISSNAMIASRSAPVDAPIRIYSEGNIKHVRRDEKTEWIFTSVGCVRMELRATSMRCHEHRVLLVEHD